MDRFASRVDNAQKIRNGVNVTPDANRPALIGIRSVVLICIRMRIWSIIPLLLSTVTAIDLNITSPDSIYSAAALIADGVMDYYWGKDPGGTIGMFTHPYY